MWKSIKNYEGLYEVSDKGEIRSVDRYICNNGTYVLVKGKMKNIRAKSNGYMICDLWKDGKAKTLHVHRIVADAFIDNPEFKTTVNHIDGDKTNNKVSNLEWATPKEQNIHFYANNLKSQENIRKAVNAMRNARMRKKEVVERWQILT